MEYFAADGRPAVGAWLPPVSEQTGVHECVDSDQAACPGWAHEGACRDSRAAVMAQTCAKVRACACEPCALCVRTFAARASSLPYSRAPVCHALRRARNGCPPVSLASYHIASRPLTSPGSRNLRRRCASERQISPPRNGTPLYFTAIARPWRAVVRPMRARIRSRPEPGARVQRLAARTLPRAAPRRRAYRRRGARARGARRAEATRGSGRSDRGRGCASGNAAHR